MKTSQGFGSSNAPKKNVDIEKYKNAENTEQEDNTEGESK